MKVASKSKTQHFRLRQKLVLILFIVTLLCGLVVISKYYLSPAFRSNNQLNAGPNSDRMATLTSPDGEFSFRFPDHESWKSESREAPLGYAASAYCNIDICSESETVDLFLVVPVIFKSNQEAIDNLIQQNNHDYQVIDFQGTKAIKSAQSGSEQVGGSMIEVFVLHNGQGYVITQRFRGLLNKSKLADFPEPNPDILSTFKFLR